MKRRRGIHSLIAVSMMIGFSVALSGILLAVLADYVDVVTNSAECSLSRVILHDVGKNAYLSGTLHNLGSDSIMSANVTLVDDLGVRHGFGSDSEIAPGQTWQVSDSFPASITAGDEYAVRAFAVYVTGSQVECSGSLVRP